MMHCAAKTKVGYSHKLFAIATASFGCLTPALRYGIPNKQKPTRCLIPKKTRPRNKQKSTSGLTEKQKQRILLEEIGRFKKLNNEMIALLRSSRLEEMNVRNKEDFVRQIQTLQDNHAKALKNKESIDRSLARDVDNPIAIKFKEAAVQAKEMTDRYAVWLAGHDIGDEVFEAELIAGEEKFSANIKELRDFFKGLLPLQRIGYKHPPAAESVCNTILEKVQAAKKHFVEGKRNKQDKFDKESSYNTCYHMLRCAQQYVDYAQLDEVQIDIFEIVSKIKDDLDRTEKEGEKRLSQQEKRFTSTVREQASMLARERERVQAQETEIRELKKKMPRHILENTHEQKGPKEEQKESLHGFKKELLQLTDSVHGLVQRVGPLVERLARSNPE